MDVPGAQAWLEELLSEHGAAAGSVHVQRGGDLHLVAWRNLPPPVLDKVRVVPRGKGMAGAAQVRRQPVQTCNLQQDTSGDINPTARLVGAKAAIALPVLDDAGEVRAVVGLAFDHEGDVPLEQVARLEARVAGVLTA